MLSTSALTRGNRIIVTSCRNPHINLATELALFNAPLRDEKILYLWRNDRVVVIGKHQNPYKECNVPFMQQNNVYLARRPTGGGAVYQDLGNTCWTFVDSRFDPKANTDILCRALKKFGIHAYGTGRNDVEVDGKKVSGAAFRREPGKSIHHGTTLMNVDMKMLASCLTVNSAKLTAKGVDSVRARVMNLVEIAPGLTHDKFCDAIISEFQKAHGKCPTEFIDEKSVLKDNEVRRIYQQLSSQEWLFGRCSNAEVTASKRFDFGLFDVMLKAESGKVATVQIHSDCLIPEVVEKFEACINNRQSLNRASLTEAERQAFINSMKNKEEKQMAEKLLQWILPEMKKWSFVKS